MISDEDVKAIAECLRETALRDNYFPSTQENARDALHTLDTGLHITDAIPTDFATVED